MTVVQGPRTRLRLARLGLVVPPGSGRSWERWCRELFRAGADLLLLEGDAAGTAQLTEAVDTALRAAAGRGLVGVSAATRPELTVDLVHLTVKVSAVPLPLAAATPYPLLGRSVATLGEIAQEATNPTTAYLTVGPVQAADGAEAADLARGLNLIRAAARLAPVTDPGGPPWFATGGVTEANLDAVLAAGACRVLVGRAILEAPDPAAAARRWGDRLRRAWRENPAFDAYSRAVHRADGTDT